MLLISVESKAKLFPQASRSEGLTVSVLVGTAVAYQLALAMVNPLLVDIARDFHVPLALAAQARTIQSAAAAAMAFVAVFVADRIPKRQQLIFGLIALGLGALMLSSADALGLWLMGQVAYGAAAGLVGLAGTAAVGDYFPVSKRGFAMAWVTTGYAIAFLAGLPAVGWLATAWSWRASYLWGGVGTATVALIAVVLGLPTLRPTYLEHPGSMGGWRQLLAAPASRGWLAGELLVMTGWAGFLLYIGPFFGVAYQLRPKEIGIVLAILSAIGILGIRASVPLAKHWGMRRVLLTCTLLAAVASLIPFSVWLSPLFSLLAAAPFAFFGSLRHPTSSTIALTLLPDAKGAMMAARGFIVATAGMLAALTGGIVLTITGFWGMGPWCGVLLGAGWVFYWRAIRVEPSH